MIDINSNPNSNLYSYIDTKTVNNTVLPTEGKASQKIIFSWALYDFANTIFSMNVISLYFALWLTVDKGAHDIYYSIALSSSMLAVALSVPIFGILSDQRQRKMPFLIILTLLCVFTTAMIGIFEQVIICLLLFFIANFCYQSSLVFYNALLPYISIGTTVSRVSGYGVSLGYIGAIAGMLMVKPFVAIGGRRWAFIPTAILFFIFSLPCLVFVKDRVYKKHTAIYLHSLKGYKFLPILLDIFTQIIASINTLKNDITHLTIKDNMSTFLLSSIFYFAVVNTTIAFMAVYANKVIGFSDTQTMVFLIVSTICAAISSYYAGILTEKRGSKSVLTGILLIWVIAIMLAATSISTIQFWVVGPLAGIGMGGVWVVSRIMVVELSPIEKGGESFGFFGFSEKTASIIGPLLWGITIKLFDGYGVTKYRIALILLTILLLISIWLLNKVELHRNIQ